MVRIKAKNNWAKAHNESKQNMPRNNNLLKSLATAERNQPNNPKIMNVKTATITRGIKEGRELKNHPRGAAFGWARGGKWHTWSRSFCGFQLHFKVATGNQFGDAFGSYGVIRIKLQDSFQAFQSLLIAFCCARKPEPSLCILWIFIDGHLEQLPCLIFVARFEGIDSLLSEGGQNFFLFSQNSIKFRGDGVQIFALGHDKEASSITALFVQFAQGAFFGIFIIAPAVSTFYFNDEKPHRSQRQGCQFFPQRLFDIRWPKSAYPKLHRDFLHSGIGVAFPLIRKGKII